jgi:hypothetical protein
LLVALMLLSGCATMDYISHRPAADVSECIAGGWRRAPRSGLEVPVSVTKSEEYYFVAVELTPPFLSPLITGLKHPFYAVWAEVRDVPSGSTTEYHRAYQIMHANIDRAVVECQGSGERPSPGRP